MRLKMFLAVAIGLLACAGSYVELVARCRCERPSRFERRAARQERRAARRGYSLCSPQAETFTPSYNPYDSGVQPLGAARPEFRWECNGGFCRLVPVTPAAPAADCPPPTAPQTSPVTEPPEPPETKTPETSASQPVGEISYEMTPEEAQRWFEAETAWRPDPPIVPPGLTSVIPQLDE